MCDTFGKNYRQNIADTFLAWNFDKNNRHIKMDSRL